MFCALLSVYVPVAVNCCVIPVAIEGSAGVTAIETNVAGLTVRLVEPLTVPDVAVTEVLPTAEPEAIPRLLTVAMLALAVVHVTDVVRTSVLPSLYVPVATSGSVVPRANEGLAGVTASETKVGCPTLSVAEPVIEPDVAVIVAPPVLTPSANPPAETVATVVDDELHVTKLVRSRFVLLLYVPVAVNCCELPTAIDEVPGETVMAVSTAAVTVNEAEPLIFPEAAVIVEVPALIPLARAV